MARGLAYSCKILDFKGKDAAMVDASIETIQPKLKAHVLIHDVLGGLGVLEIPGKCVLLLTADETRLCKSFNGSRNFTEILSDASSSGDVMSVRSPLVWSRDWSTQGLSRMKKSSVPY